MLSPFRCKNGLWVFGQEWDGSQQFSSFMKNAVEPTQANLEIANPPPPVAGLIYWWEKNENGEVVVVGISVMSLIEHLQQIRDFRTQPRYPLWVVLLLVIMGTMSDCLGYRALEDFVERHQKVLLKLIELPHKRLPSYSTIRRVMVRIDFQALTQAFNTWATEAFAVSGSEQVALDGKSIKASVKDYDNAYQDFVSVVSAFSVQQGVVVGLQAMHNHSESEIVTVQSLLDVLQLKGVCFSMDALHTQKKRLSKSSTVAMTT